MAGGSAGAIVTFLDSTGKTVVVDDANPLPVAATATIEASEVHIGAVGGTTAKVEASFTRPADATTYASGDLVANNTTAGSVTPMEFTVARVAGGSGMIRRARVRKTSTGVTGASFRLHLYLSAPTPQNGDNGVWSTNKAADYVGALDVTVDRAFTDGAAGNGIPTNGAEINFDLPDGQTKLYGLLEARGAYAPGSGETITVGLEVIQN